MVYLHLSVHTHMQRAAAWVLSSLSLPCFLETEKLEPSWQSASLSDRKVSTPCSSKTIGIKGHAQLFLWVLGI